MTYASAIHIYDESQALLIIEIQGDHKNPPEQVQRELESLATWACNQSPRAKATAPERAPGAPTTCWRVTVRGAGKVAAEAALTSLERLAYEVHSFSSEAEFRAILDAQRDAASTTG